MKHVYKIVTKIYQKINYYKKKIFIYILQHLLVSARLHILSLNWLENIEAETEKPKDIVEPRSHKPYWIMLTITAITRREIQILVQSNVFSAVTRYWPLTKGNIGMRVTWKTVWRIRDSNRQNLFQYGIISFQESILSRRTLTRGGSIVACKSSWYSLRTYKSQFWY